MAFGQFNFGAFSLFSLSLSHSWTLRVFLELSSFGARKEKESKGRIRKGKESKYQARRSRIEKLQQEYLQVI